MARRRGRGRTEKPWAPGGAPSSRASRAAPCRLRADANLPERAAVPSTGEACVILSPTDAARSLLSALLRVFSVQLQARVGDCTAASGGAFGLGRARPGMLRAHGWCGVSLRPDGGGLAAVSLSVESCACETCDISGGSAGAKATRLKGTRRVGLPSGVCVGHRPPSRTPQRPGTPCIYDIL